MDKIIKKACKPVNNERIGWSSKTKSSGTIDTVYILEKVSRKPLELIFSKAAKVENITIALNTIFIIDLFDKKTMYKTELKALIIRENIRKSYQ